jgi:hypothetical protein
MTLYNSQNGSVINKKKNQRLLKILWRRTLLQNMRTFLGILLNNKKQNKLCGP